MSLKFWFFLIIKTSEMLLYTQEEKNKNLSKAQRQQKVQDHADEVLGCSGLTDAS